MPAGEPDPAAGASALHPPAVPAPPHRAQPAAADALALGLLLFWGAVFVLRIHIGIDVTDEGMYLSTVDRLVHGDLPFRDDHENPLRQFDVLLAWLWGPAGGFSLLAARVAGIGLQLAQMAALWLVVRRWQGAWVAAVTCCLVPCSPLFGIWTPGYNECSCAATVLSGCCLALALGAGARAEALFSIAAGIGLGLDWLCYAPTVALGLVPLALIVLGWRHSWRHPWVVCGGIVVAVALMICALDAAWIVGAGLGGDWRAAYRDMALQQDDFLPLRARIAECWRRLADVRIHVLVTVAALGAWAWLLRVAARRGAGGRGAGSRWAGLVAICALLAGPLAVLAYDLPASFAPTPAEGLWCGDALWVVRLWFTEIIIGAACVVVFVVPPALPALWRGRQHPGAGVAIACVMYVLYAGITMLSSSLLQVNSLHIRGALLALGAAGLAAAVRAAPAWRGTRPLLISGGLGMAILAALVGWGSWTLVFKDAHAGGCTATFRMAPLAGVRSTPQQVAALEALKTWVDAHAAPDARVIAYNDCPGLYFALQRRPALDLTWTNPQICLASAADSAAFLARLLERMRVRGRHADVCVRQDGLDAGTWPDLYFLSDPVHAYVDGHFAAAWCDWPYTVLVPATAPAPAPVVLADLVRTDPGAAAARVYLSPGTTIANDAGGGIVITTHAAPGTPIVGLFEHGADAVRLRLRLATREHDVAIVLARGGLIAPYNGRSDPGIPGVDATYPAGAEEDRGFAVIVTPDAPAADDAAPRRIVLDTLRLEELPPPRMP
jgi:hypothetical protein